MGCSDSGIYEVKDECSVKDDTIFEMLVTGTCDPDVGLLYQGMKIGTACETATAEAACSAVQKPSIPAQPTCNELKATGDAATAKRNELNLAEASVSGAIHGMYLSFTALAVVVATMMRFLD